MVQGCSSRSGEWCRRSFLTAPYKKCTLRGSQQRENLRVTGRGLQARPSDGAHVVVHDQISVAIIIEARSGAHDVAGHHARTCAASCTDFARNRGTHRTRQRAVDGDGVRSIPTSDRRHDLCADLRTVRHSRSADPAHVRGRLVPRDLPRIGPTSAPRRAPEHGQFAHLFVAGHAVGVTHPVARARGMEWDGAGRRGSARRDARPIVSACKAG